MRSQLFFLPFSLHISGNDVALGGHCMAKWQLLSHVDSNSFRTHLDLAKWIVLIYEKTVSPESTSKFGGF